MIWAIVAALLSAVVLTVAAPPLARRLPPAAATVGLTGAAVAAVIGTAYVLGTMAFTWIAQFPEVAEQGDWSPLLLRRADPVPGVVAALSGVVLITVAVRAVRSVRRNIGAHRRMRQALAGLDHDGGLIILDLPHPDAYATAAGGGRIVVTTAMLAALEPGEHHAVIAHERAHLALRHSWWLVAADLAAAANPLLRPITAAVGESVERWADERAATAVGDRRLVARALARAALVAHASRPVAALAMVGGPMPRRVSALLAPPPRRRLLPMILLAALLATVAGATLSVEVHADHLFDSASIPCAPGPAADR